MSPVDGPSDGGFTFREAIGKLALVMSFCRAGRLANPKSVTKCRVPLQDEGYQPARWNANGSVRRRHVFQPEGTSNASFTTCKYLQKDAMVRTTIPGRRYRRRAVGVPARLCPRGRRRCCKVPRDTARWRERSVRSLVAPSSTISSRTFVSLVQTTRSLKAPPAGALEHQAPLRTAPHARTIILTCMGVLARVSIAAPSRRLRTAHRR